MTAHLDPETLIAERDRLLASASEHFASDPLVVAVFLGGSLAAGTADAYSDIDLRVVVTADSHPWFVANRREIPKAWPGFLFNEWIPGAQHCVSHFSPFGKIDIFYLSADALRPSPWYRLPINILHDPDGVVADLIARSRDLSFSVSEDDLDISISKGLAAAHETYRRAKRGELLYAQTLLDELRQRIMQADDWLGERTPEAAIVAKFEARASAETLAVLNASYGPNDVSAILAALRVLVAFYRNQVLALHDTFRLQRSRENDLAALDDVLALV